MKANVLVVDDEKNIRFVLKRYIQQAGFEVETASDGEKGFELILSHHFDIVITDLMMPNMSGLEFIEAIEITQPNIPIVIITAFLESEGVKKFLDKNNTYTCLKKPFKLSALVETINSTLDLSNEPV